MQARRNSIAKTIQISLHSENQSFKPLTFRSTNTQSRKLLIHSILYIQEIKSSGFTFYRLPHIQPNNYDFIFNQYLVPFNSPVLVKIPLSTRSFKSLEAVEEEDRLMR